MNDLISLAVIAAVIALLMGYVRICHRMIGDPAESAPPSPTASADGADITPPGSSGRAR